MDSPIYQRVRAELDRLNLTDNQASLAASGKKNRDLLRNLKKGTVKTGSAEGLAGLARLIGKSVDWILTGDEHADSRTVVPIEDVEGPPQDVEHERNGYAEGVPYRGARVGAIAEIDVEGGAGEGTVGEVIRLESDGIQSGHRVTGEWVLPPEIARTLRGAPGNVVIMPVEGDSMEPVLRSGDRVFVDLTSRNPKDGGIFVLDEGHGPIVKRARYLSDTDPLQIEIISENPRLEPYRRRAQDVRVIGRVRGRWTAI